jgi:multiple sugar transport system substrate-binding protein
MSTLRRRELLLAAAGAAAASVVGLPASGSAAPPRGQIPGPKPDRLVIGILGPTGPDDDVIRDGLKQFTADYGVRADILFGGDAEFFNKALAWYASGEQVDAIFVRENFLGPWVKDGLLQPVTAMAGLDSYRPDLVEAYWQSMYHFNQVWGLPWYSEILTAWYNEDKFARAGLKQSPTTWDELLDQAQRAKRDGTARYPILWAAGAGDHHRPWQWFVQVWSRGGTLFDKNNDPLLGPGSVARTALDWWRKTFQQWEVSDPRSVELRYIPAMKVFMTGQHVFSLAMFNTYLFTINDPSQSPIAGKVKMFVMPGNGKTMGYNRIIGMMSTAKNKDWTWELMQYIGGRTKAGRYLVQREFAIKRFYGPGYKSIWNDAELRHNWSKYTDFALIRRQWDQAAHSSIVVPATYEAWYQQWLDVANVQIESCLQGKITADAACDALARKARELRQTTR